MERSKTAVHLASMGTRRTIVMLAIVASGVLALVADGALAQQQRPATLGPNGRASVRPPGAKKPAGADAGASGTPTSSLAAAAPAVPPASSPSADGGVVEAKTLDGGTRVFKFSELDIEGRLKSPQLVYFLRRVRAEFAAGDLGHRSFMREMSETRRESSF
jgi:hypothetical protein